MVCSCGNRLYQRETARGICAPCVMDTLRRWKTLLGRRRVPQPVRMHDINGRKAE
jgi:hypothetical protein